MFMVLIEFKKGYESYIPGDIAGFTRNIANNLVKQGVGKIIYKKDNTDFNKKYNFDKKIADIIIPHHDQHELLRNVLEVLPNNIFNIIIVSGGTFSENCNKGAKLAETENLIFMNDDIKPNIDSLIRSCKMEADIVGFSEILPNKNNKILYGIGLREKRRDGYLPTILKENFDQVYLPSAFLMRVKKDVWKELGGFDEQFKNGVEDIDFGLRAKKAGKRFDFIRQSPIVHYQSQSSGRWDNTDDNKIKFFKKWSEEEIKKVLNVNNLYKEFKIKDKPINETVNIILIETIKGECEKAIKTIETNTQHPYKITVYDNTKEKSKNLTKTWNKLLKNSKYRYNCLINTDTEVQEGWLKEIMKGFQKENALLVTPSGDNVFGKQSRLIETYKADKNCFKNLDYFSGFCFVLDKDKMKDIGYFDEEVSFYGNEKVFAVKVRKSKYLMLWAKGSYVKHINESTVREMGLFDELREKGFKEKAEWYAKNSPVLFLTFNRLEFTKKAYKSLINSGVEHIIIIDNNSTDGTKEWIAKRKSKKIDKIILNDKNIGIAGAMSQFFEITKGERYIGKVDNDTIVPYGWFEKLIDICERKRVDIIQPKHKIFNNRYKTWEDWWNALPDLGKSGLKLSNYVGGSAVTIRRDKIKSKISPVRGMLSGWTEYQKARNDLKKVFTDKIEIELLDMIEDNKYDYQKYPDYYQNFGRLKELNKKL